MCWYVELAVNVNLRFARISEALYYIPARLYDSHYEHKQDCPTQLHTKNVTINFVFTDRCMVNDA